MAARWPGSYDPFRTALPLQRQYPVRGLAVFVGEQLPRGRNSLVDVVVDAGNAEGHTVESLQVLVFDRRDVKHPKLRIA